jgi:hypothetical protein
LPPDAEAAPAKSYAIHAGFYRNVRATRFAVIVALERALDRRSVLDDDPESPRPPMEKPMRRALPQLLIGLGAAAVTYGLGLLFGAGLA